MTLAKKYSTRLLLPLALGLMLGVTAPLAAQEKAADSPAAPAKQSPDDAAPQSDESQPAEAGAALALRQSQIADRYKRLEELIYKLAAIEASENPQRAALLTRAYKQSQDALTRLELEKTVDFLTQQKYAHAVDAQGSVQGQLKALLELLQSENRADRVKSEQQRIREYIKEVDRLIRIQRGIQGRNEGGADADRLAKEQQQAAERTVRLNQQIQQDQGGQGQQGEGKEGEGKEGEGKEGEGKEGEGKEGEGKEGEGKEGEGKEGEGKEGEGKEGEGKEGEGKEGEGKEGEGKEGEGKEGEGKEGEGKEGEGKEGEGKEGEGKEGEGKEGEGKEGEGQEGEGQEGEGQGG